MSSEIKKIAVLFTVLSVATIQNSYSSVTKFTPKQNLSSYDIFESEYSRVNKKTLIHNNDDDTLYINPEKYDNSLHARANPLQGNIIEVVVVSDPSMSQFHGDKLTEYILNVMSETYQLFRHPSIGNLISIAVLDIIETDKVFTPKLNKTLPCVPMQMLLEKFCTWQNKSRGIELPLHYDVALLMTRNDVWCSNVVGVGRTGNICSEESCAAVKDEGISTAPIIAHEFGHLLSLSHDTASRCSKHPDALPYMNIMSPSMGAKPWMWSTCSKYYLTQLFEKDSVGCLLNKPAKIMKLNYTLLPGQIYSMDEQCRLKFGPRSTASNDTNFNCEKICCYIPHQDGQYTKCLQYSFWADGTFCGKKQWCRRGECVQWKILKPIDGGWGKWSHSDGCSRMCGGGIQKEIRECDNPKPRNGGNYCSGKHFRFWSCNTQECLPGSEDFRQQQCSQENNNNHNFSDVSKDVKWHVKHFPKDEECMLFCQANDKDGKVYKLKAEVVDGTKCGPDTFDMCVFGQCKPAGCDHELNSDAKLDLCGVCRGDNSTCKKIIGYYNVITPGNTRYSVVTVIPKGSTFIDIRQVSYSGDPKDQTYLALRIGSKYILNGEFILRYDFNIREPGVSIDYSGWNSVVERLNTSRPISVDLTLEVLITAQVIWPPQISFEYFRPKTVFDLI